ncbi:MULTISPECIES: DUF6111 family protein [unclassified Methylobacterium]|jgi:hypothetical protein|uniref:DUF6111 family protein n=1 Tax=unclassified Methylobacterium TaxID=2615210 RepID=UPI0006F98134|nr:MULTISPECIES: DUF6111 family protein [unclassified Methylobacterium]KQO66747.1 hypothetical protein ASF18_08360 [Methylobacterium sp. Leaf89]KQO77806.1 hypothetical protein ASF20_12540 [Methylobacterium sp. Leaf88]KQP62561.1 hypothetical protein ASF41_08130 [Methylobacterium sp. Leaf111]KQT76749.1 hypothetical protein ASG51_07825 [Methylobacterium sp. Leaf465]KQU33255.1 hypothetical protein ASG63_15295 [Methylobacterium sp. Leaf94]
MIRRVLEELLIFLSPFLLYALYLAVRGRRPDHGVHWDGQAFRLTLAGIVLVVLSLVATGLFSERHRGGYVPPHLENGQVVPGRFQ